MRSNRRTWKWILLAVAGLVVLPIVMLGLGVLSVIPVRTERSPMLEQEAAATASPDAAPSPVIAPASPLLSLNPQDPVQLFVVMPLFSALVLLPIGGVGGLVWWRWLRPRDDGGEIYGNGDEGANGTRIRYVLFGLLFWIALSVIFVFDLLGSASLYPQFVAIYAAFWILIGALLLYDRPLQEKVPVLIVFLILVFSLRFVNWNSRKPFLRSLYRIEEGMTHRQVEQVMGGYPGSAGADAEIDEEGYIVVGTISYTHTDEGWGNSDRGLLTFQGGRVVAIEFLPD